MTKWYDLINCKFMRYIIFISSYVINYSNISWRAKLIFGWVHNYWFTFLYHMDVFCSCIYFLWFKVVKFILILSLHFVLQTFNCIKTRHRLTKEHLINSVQVRNLKRNPPTWEVRNLDIWYDVLTDIVQTIVIKNYKLQRKKTNYVAFHEYMFMSLSTNRQL